MTLARRGPGRFAGPTTMPPTSTNPRFSVNPAQVDLWWLDATGHGAGDDPLEDVLTPAERSSVERAVSPELRHQRRFFRARQRQILSLYTGLEPRAHRFVEGPQGKPALADPAPLAYNLTHSGDCGLLAITGASAVGIDLESTTRAHPFDDLARRFFAPAEVAALQALGKAERRAAFFTTWVRKEAWVKALGTGLVTPLDQFIVSVDGDRTSDWLLDAGPTGDAPAWTFGVPAPLPRDGFAAAFAVAGNGVRAVWRDGASIRSASA